MADSRLAKKLAIKRGMKVAFFQAPPEFWEELGPLPEGVEAVSNPGGEPDSYDLALLFVKLQAELADQITTVLAALKYEGVLWVSYPKQSAGVETDLTRDQGWDAMRAVGMKGGSVVSIDDAWSAMRFRTAHRSRRRPGNPAGRSS